MIALALIISAAQFLKRHPEKIGLLPYGREANATETDPAKYHKSSVTQDFSLSEAVKGQQFWMILALFFFFEFSILSIMESHPVELLQGQEPQAAVCILVIVIQRAEINNRGTR